MTPGGFDTAFLTFTFRLEIANPEPTARRIPLVGTFDGCFGFRFVLCVFYGRLSRAIV